jgi:glycerol-3-phosphate dehydrogenase
LRAVRAMYPSLQVGPQDVLSSWAGLRPLIYEEGKGPSELSRKDEIFLASSGLITIAGGKLTGFRKMAEKVVNLVAQQLQVERGVAFGRCTTDRAPISGGNFGGLAFEEWKKQAVYLSEQRGIAFAEIERLIELYGSNVSSILQRYDECEDDNLECRLLAAEVSYAIEEEMALKASDFLNRRSAMMYFAPERADRLADLVTELMGQRLGWTESRRLAELAEIRAEHRACTLQ